jgi:putative endonuclease
MITRHGHEIFHYVYVIENDFDLSWYIGFTLDLRRRLQDHNHGKSMYTSKKKGGWRIIYGECYLSKTDALSREKFLKSGSGRKFLKNQLKNYLNRLPL